MKKNRKLIPLLATASSLMLAFSLVIGAAAAAAPPVPFIGTWTSTDTDGSTQTLRIGAGTAGGYHAVYFDDGATVCGFDANGDFLAGSMAVGAIGALGNTLEGLLPVYCMASPRYLYDLDALFSLTYDSSTDTFTDIHGVVWYRAH
ncbi:MAG TPA: hypothetical protein VIU38_03760 [Anaerolineales bacterium]